MMNSSYNTFSEAVTQESNDTFSSTAHKHYLESTDGGEEENEGHHAHVNRISRAVRLKKRRRVPSTPGNLTIDGDSTTTYGVSHLLKILNSDTKRCAYKIKRKQITKKKSMIDNTLNSEKLALKARKQYVINEFAKIDEICKSTISKKHDYISF